VKFVNHVYAYGYSKISMGNFFCDIDISYLYPLHDNMWAIRIQYTIQNSHFLVSMHDMLFGAENVV
jgi:hypothetical protein